MHCCHSDIATQLVILNCHCIIRAHPFWTESMRNCDGATPAFSCHFGSWSTPSLPRREGKVSNRTWYLPSIIISARWSPLHFNAKTFVCDPRKTRTCNPQLWRLMLYHWASEPCTFYIFSDLYRYIVDYFSFIYYNVRSGSVSIIVVHINVYMRQGGRCLLWWLHTYRRSKQVRLTYKIYTITFMAEWL